ncbi:MAG: DUF177 domain-containing protein, partial [candidate division Zixibacteria bacterium]|nr:DUF177 domain-containing protein [candidate division Zixibacteria bacterium]
MVRLCCDLSLKEFEELIKADLLISFVRGNPIETDLEEETDEAAEYVIFHDDKEIDISSIVREELVLSLPMKRISPVLRGK